MEWIIEAETLIDVINRRRCTIKSTSLVRCCDCIHVEHDTVFGQWWCNGKLKSPYGYCDEGRRTDGTDRQTGIE